MIKLHHLNESRSQRILWLLEELGLDYEIVPYTRNPETRLAPPELEAVHPLGKSPVIEDGAVKIAESGAIVEYLCDTYGQGKVALPTDPAERAAYVEWLHYAEGSAMLPLMLHMYVARLGEAGGPLHPRIESEIKNHLGYIDGALGGKMYLLGEAGFSGADVMISFVAEVARAFGKLKDYPNLDNLLDRMHARPAWKAALAKGGTYALGR
jgi:glutathione S-transferase